MKTRQTIAVIGATGHLGSAISRNLSRGNYKLLLCGDSDTLELTHRIIAENPSAHVEAVDCVVNASWEADIIIAAVPHQAEKDLAERIREMANQKIVISIANPLNDTHDRLVTSPDTSAGEELQKLLPNSKVIKAFNTTFAADFATPAIDAKRVDAFIAGDDQDALDTVAEIVSTAGFNPIVAGKLSVSSTLEHSSY